MREPDDGDRLDGFQLVAVEEETPQASELDAFDVLEGHSPLVV